MPSVREKGLRVTVTACDVIGVDGDLPGFIRHTGLATNDGVQDRADVEVSDMGPPIGATSRMRADTVSSAELSADEIRKIKAFVEKHYSEHKATQLTRSTIPEVYCILPHSAPLAGSDGRYSRIRFSCADLYSRRTRAWDCFAK